MPAPTTSRRRCVATTTAFLDQIEAMRAELSEPADAIAPCDAQSIALEVDAKQLAEPWLVLDDQDMGRRRHRTDRIRATLEEL